MNNITTLKLDLETLQRGGPLLWAKALRPGDVLLVRGNSPFSSVIVKVSSGQYSHAAIWIPGGNSDPESLSLAESDTAGVGFTPLLPMSLYLEGNSPAEQVYRIPDNPKMWTLLRHPACADIDIERMRKASKELQDNEFYKTYSAVPRLLEAVKLPDFPHILATNIAQAIEHCRVDKGTRGTFCSELVATFFSRLGLELFSDGRAPHTVSPNDFLAPECHLQVVADAFVDKDSLLPGTHGYGSVFPIRKADPHLRTMINTRSAYDRLDASFQSAETALRELTIRVNKQQNQIAAVTARQFAEQILQAEQWNEPDQIVKLHRSATMFSYGHRLLQCLAEYDDRMRYGNTPDVDISSWNDASFMLRRVANQMMFKAQRALVRHTLLSGLRRKRKDSNTIASRTHAIKFRRLRKTLFKTWRDYRKGSEECLDFSEKLLATGELSAQAQAYINDVIQTAYHSLINESLSQEEVEGSLSRQSVHESI